MRNITTPKGIWHIRRAAAATLLVGFGSAMATLTLGGCKQASDPTLQAPSGGANYVLDFAQFTTQVAPLLTSSGCDNVSCHGGGIRGTFQLSPSTDKNFDLDFAQAGLQVNGANPTSSPLLVKPLAEAAGGDIHTGGAAFASTDEPEYQVILMWVEAGEFE